MSASVLGLIAIVVASGLLIALERLRPYDRGHPLIHDGFWVDLIGYAIVQSYVLGVAIGALVGPPRDGLVSQWSFGAQLAFFVVTHDLYIYWFHRLQHRVPLLWRIHEAHHSAVHVDWLAGARSHSIEILINQTIEFGALIALGASPEVIVAKGAVSAIWGMWIHSNIDVRTGWLQLVINGPEMHRWHHAREYRGPYGANFATKLAVWDWLFGTAYRPADARPTAYGLAEPFPRGYLAQHAHAFRRRDAES
jgi:sterol desaturase/sphingolipid hydroxylase (fatty acid hydroxylase superfamily)